MRSRKPSLVSEPLAGGELTTDWGLDATISGLRNLREASLASRQRFGTACNLPSRKELARIVEHLSMALFPNRLGSRPMNPESIDCFVGNILDATCRDLFEQALLELQLVTSDETLASSNPRTHAERIVRGLVDSLPRIRKLLDSDLQAAFDGDPAARNVDEVLVCYPGITATIHYRIAHVLYTMGLPLVARMIAEIAHGLTGIDIHPGAQIQESFFIDHGTGVVIGQTAVIGRRVRIYHGVTLGAKRFPTDDQGVIRRDYPRHPIVEDDVIIYAGASILGLITIGQGAIVGGNVWVTQNVPAGSVITQAETRSESFHEGGGI